MLPRASLQLDSYYFTTVDVRFNRTAFSEEPSPLSLEDLDSSFNVFDFDEDDGRGNGFVVNLEVSTVPHIEGGKLIAVDFTIALIGRFIVDEQLKAKVDAGKMKQELIISSALALLYGSIRDQLFSITAKMPVGPIYLPTCTFPITLDDADQEDADTGNITKSAKRKGTARNMK